jgi:hypothetical protein
VTSFTGYAGVFQHPSELNISTEMADLFLIQRITAELNLTIANAYELYENSNKGKVHPLTCHEGTDGGRGIPLSFL